MAEIQAAPSTAVSITAELGAPSGTSPAPADPARAGSFRLGTVRILDSGPQCGFAGGELRLNRTSYLASKAISDPNHLSLEGAPEALRLPLRLRRANSAGSLQIDLTP